MMADGADSLDISHAWAKYYINPSQTPNSFGLLVFERHNGSNEKFTQLVDLQGRVKGFEVFVAGDGVKARKLPNEIYVEIGSEAPAVFVGDNGLIIFGVINEIKGQLLRILPHLRDRPLVALSVSRLCAKPKVIQNFVRESYRFIETLVSVSAAKSWLDQCVIMPEIRKTIFDMFGPSNENHDLEIFIDSLMYHRGLLIIHPDSNYAFNEFGTKMLLNSVKKNVPADLEFTKFRIVTPEEFRRITSPRYKQLLPADLVYGPFHITNLRGVGLVTDLDQFKFGIRFYVNKQNEIANVNVKYGALPAGRKGIEFFTSVLPSTPLGLTPITWQNTKRNGILRKTMRGRSYLIMPITTFRTG